MARNRYPVYVLSKGRPRHCLTARFLIKDEVPFKLVIEEEEYDQYARYYDDETIVVLPPESSGHGAVPVRNWIWEDALESGSVRHWILDDNIWNVRRWYRGERIPMNSGIAFAAAEDFVDRYENVGIAGLNYMKFCIPGRPVPPFYKNVHVYSCMLILNELDARWRGQMNADTDLCLQVLAAGWCTVLFNAFMADKVTTMIMAGGNTSRYTGDGRRKMARELERRWPGVVTTKRRYGRPQHVVKDSWKGFDTPLIRREGVEIPEEANEYGMRLRQVAPEIRSPDIQRLLDDYEADHPAQ